MTEQRITDLEREVWRLRRQLTLAAHHTGGALLTIQEISTRYGVRLGAVYQWAHRYEDFPEPLVLGPGWPRLYRDVDVETWMALPHRRAGRQYAPKTRLERVE